MANFLCGHEANAAVSPGLEGRTAPPWDVITQSSIKYFFSFDEPAERARGPLAWHRRRVGRVLCAVRNRARCGIIAPIFLEPAGRIHAFGAPIARIEGGMQVSRTARSGLTALCQAPDAASMLRVQRAQAEVFAGTSLSSHLGSPTWPQHPRPNISFRASRRTGRRFGRAIGQSVSLA